MKCIHAYKYFKMLCFLLFCDCMAYCILYSARLCVLDNIFTRMGAGDDLAAGMSTFMNELSRTSNILSQVTCRSLVVLDELGRGTSTNDGVAIALSTLRYIVQKTGCALLFVTHYPQVTHIVYAPLLS